MAEDADNQEREARQDPAPEPAAAPDPTPDPEPAAPAAPKDRAPRGRKADDWRAGIADEEIRAFARDFASPADAAATAFRLDRKLAGAVMPPGEGATQDEVAAFRKALGVPEAPENYAISIPEDLPRALQLDEAGKARIGDYLKAMHGAGAPPSAVQAGIDAYFRMAADALKARERAADEAREDADAALTQEWGTDRTRQVEMARRAVAAFGDEEFREFLDSNEAGGVPLGDHPAFVRAFAQVGRRMAEGTMPSPMSEGERAGLKARIDEIHALQHSDPQKYKSAAIQDELQSLYAKSGGTAPVMGSEGRVV